MALEPVEVTANITANHELTDMTWRFRVALVLALPVFVLEMGGHVPALELHRLVPPDISVWVQFTLSTPVVLWAGWQFFQRGWASLASRPLNMFTLVALGTGAAYLYSLVATFAPRIFPAGFRSMDGTVPAYYEAAAVISVLVLLGQVLELRARERTGDAIRALLSLAPRTTRRVRDGVRHPPQPRGCGTRHVPQLGLRHRQCASAASGKSVRSAATMTSGGMNTGEASAAPRCWRDDPRHEGVGFIRPAVRSGAGCRPSRRGPRSAWSGACGFPAPG